jgi:hypothetical protein
MDTWKKSLSLSILLLLIIVLFISEGAQILEKAEVSDSRSPVKTTLDWDGKLGLHQTVTLTVQVTSDIDADQMRLQWVIPSGVTLAGTATEILGPISAGQMITHQREVTFHQADSFKVVVSAQIEFADNQSIYGDADVLYFDIKSGLFSRVSRQGPRIRGSRELIEAPEVSISAPDQPDQGYWVRGRFMFEDREVIQDSNPPTITFTTVPARQVRVEVWEDDGVIDGPSTADDHDCTTRTDDDGYFECWIADNDDISGSKETYVRIYTDTPGGHVTDISGLDRDYYCYTPNQSGGSDIDFGTLTPTSYDPMFNIADALLDAYHYALQFRSSMDQAHARYEPGRGVDGSYYSSVQEEINIQDAGADTDPYDDSVIIHEYGHFFADEFACDKSEGGEHFWDRHYSNELAWSEGWANYLPSAVMGTPWYMNINDAGGWAVHINLETWDVDRGVTGSDNEGAVAATLWDIHDSVDETHDRMSEDGDEIWNTFDGQMHDSDECTIVTFWNGWHSVGYPDDSELASIFAHHGTANVTVSASSQTEGSVRADPDQPVEANVIEIGPKDRTVQPAGGFIETVMRGGLPWEAVLFLIDATNSMADKIDAVTQIIQDKVTEMEAEEDHPYEFIVETFQDNGTNTHIVDHFFPDVVNPPLDTITVGGGGDPAEDTFAALARGTRGRPGYDAWLFTDAAPKFSVSQVELEALLQSREITPYFFIFGDCTDGNVMGVQEEVSSDPDLLNHLQFPRFAPAALEDCVEPYLLAAGSTNGQFLFIDTSQIDDAAEIVRAFMSNNAGSGRYADYVSTSWTYTWEDASEYYDWIDATGGTQWNIYDRQEILLPGGFPFYGTDYDRFYAAAAGYISFSDFPVVRNNTGIPTVNNPNNAIYAFWDDISAYQLPMVGESPDQSTGIYTLYNPGIDVFTIEYYQAYHVLGGATPETFEILLDYNTGEIWLQYADITDDSSCTVGVENTSGTNATQVNYNNPGSLYPGRAIRFIPMPPQPTRDHEVIVDSSMDNIIFMLNGYSGNVDLTVYRPNGTPINPSDPDVSYMQVGKVIYYRVSSPASGTWIGRASGNGTYYFTSSSTSGLEADYEGDQTMSSDINNVLLLDLGMSLTVQPDFILVHSDGSFFDNIDLYDDGAHGDGEADDGLYGGTYNAPDDGTFYLQVDGQTQAGEDFRRTALTPIRFQGMELVPPSPDEMFALPGDTLNYNFRVYNDTSELRVFSVQLDSSQGWASTPIVKYVIGPGSSTIIPVTVNVPAYAGNVVEETILTAYSSGMSDSASAATTVRGWVTVIDLAAYPDRIYNNGGQALIVAQVEDDLGWSVADGTEVSFSTSLGSVNPSSGFTINGLVTATLTSSAATGIADVQATADSLSQVVSVEIVPPEAHSLTLSAADNILPPDGTSTTSLTAHVYDKFGDPAPDGSEIVFNVEGDAMEMGDIEGQESYTTTISGGVSTVTYRSSTTQGVATVRAAINIGGSFGGGEGVDEWRWARQDIQLTYYGYNTYLPLVKQDNGSTNSTPSGGLLSPGSYTIILMSSGVGAGLWLRRKTGYRG